MKHSHHRIKSVVVMVREGGEKVIVRDREIMSQREREGMDKAMNKYGREMKKLNWGGGGRGGRALL